VAGAPKVNGLSVGPNPFNPLVKLNYAVATPGRVSLRIYDVRGALVTTLVDEVKTQGRYQAVWAGQDDAGRKMPSGVFWAKYSVGKNDITRQLVLLK
jgi:flagellar hook assembly protein FlgD